MFIGAIVLIIGVVYLLSNLGLITASVAQIFWPLVIIAIGLKMLFHHKHHHCWTGWDSFERRMHEKCNCEGNHSEEEL